MLAAVILPIPVELALAGYIVYLTIPDASFMGLGIFGAFLASIVLYVFLRRFSMTFIVVACIPFSLIVWGWLAGLRMPRIRSPPVLL